MLASCGKPAAEFEIHFGVAYDDKPISCGDGSPALTDLRFYVHELALKSESGEWIPLALADDEAWQQRDLAMIDLETGDCVNGTGQLRPSIVGHAPAGSYDGLRFTLGVPFDRNHADPLAADPPLDDAAMHWHWRSGYKFLRAGVRNDEGSFWIHLGSTGCEGTVGDIVSCSRPNRVRVQLESLDPGTERVVFDLSALTENIDLAGSSECVSSPAEDSCRVPFTALGLDFDTGTMATDQQVFVARPR